MQVLVGWWMVASAATAQVYFSTLVVIKLRVPVINT